MTLLEAMLAESPWGLWPLTETSGSTAHNAVTGGPDGTYGTSVTLAGTLLPNGVHVYKPSTDGTDQNGVTFPGADLTTMPNGNSSYTLAGVFKTTDTGDNQGIVAMGAGSTNALTALFVNPGGGVYTAWGGSDVNSTAGADPTIIYSDPAATDGIRVNMLVATYDGTTRIIYLNGSEIVRDTPGAGHAGTTDNLWIGSTDDRTNVVSDGCGYVGIYGHNVSAATVAAWYLALHSDLTTLDDFLTPLAGAVFPMQDVTGRDTLKSLDGTRTLAIENSGIDSSTDAGPKASLKSWKFNGSGYLSVDDSSGLPTGIEPYTLFVMANPNTSGNSSFLGYGDWTTSNAANGMYQYDVSGVEANWKDNALDSGVRLPMNVDRWHLVASTFDGTTRTIWQDNVADSSDTPTGGVIVSSNLEIGRINEDNGICQKGHLCYAAVLPVALTYTQMSHLAAFMLADIVDDTPLEVDIGSASGMAIHAYVYFGGGGGGGGGGGTGANALDVRSFSGMHILALTVGYYQFAPTSRSGMAINAYVPGRPPRVMTIPVDYFNGSGSAMQGASVQASVDGLADGQILLHINGDVIDPVSDLVTTDVDGHADLTLIPSGDFREAGHPWLIKITGGTPV